MSSANEQQHTSSPAQAGPGPANNPTADEIEKARAFLAAIEARVFADVAPTSRMEHAGLIRQTTRRLFRHGR